MNGTNMSDTAVVKDELDPVVGGGVTPPADWTPPLEVPDRPPTPPLPTIATLFSPDSPRGSRSPSPSPRRTRVKFEDEVYSRSPSEKPGEPSRSKASSSTPTTLGPTLVPELPLAWDEALQTFTALDKCVYERKDLGLSREQDEMMVCDCTYDPDDPHGSACGADSDCINRAIFIECLSKECRAGKHCRNQRLSKGQYGPVEVVLTEKKGYGLRAKEDIRAGSLIYEYLGEVVRETTFRQRMAKYAEEGIKHFYFMMLQKEEYIDATKKGGIGRFANHSCNPNSEVQKWVVGRRMRMGIFTKRDVLANEEITFNYNVDRYGHEAQICYCGEYNCVGTIGGKTQTDIGGMDDLFLDALGIMDEVSANGMKGSRKKKARQLAEDDYVPVLHPIQDHETNKVSAAIRQSMENPRMMGLLLERVKMSDDPVIQRQLMRMHGFSLMTMILTDLAADRNIVKLALESLLSWKLTIRNKIEDSNIEEPVKALRDGPDEELSDMAKRLLEYWDTLDLSYKIPRVSKIASLDADDEQNTTTIAEEEAMPRRHIQLDDLTNTAGIALDLAPIRRGPAPIPIRYRAPPPQAPRPQPPPQANDRFKLEAIIAMAQQAQTVTPTPEPARVQTPVREKEEPRKRQKTSHRALSAEEERRKEKRLTVLVGEVVVNSLSKYKSQMEHDTFKRYAKECTDILVDKEKRGHSYAAHRNPSLSDEKKAKIKAFTKEFAHKVLRKLKAKGKLRRMDSQDSSGSTRRSSPLSTPTGTPSQFSMTPSATYSTTPVGGTPNGHALLDDIFGTSERDHYDHDSMEVDTDEAGTSTPQVATPSISAPGTERTPVSPPSLSPSAGKAVIVEHSGPFLKRPSGPILVDRVENLRFSSDGRKDS